MLLTYEVTHKDHQGKGLLILHADEALAKDPDVIAQTETAMREKYLTVKLVGTFDAVAGFGEMGIMPKDIMGELAAGLHAGAVVGNA